MKYLLANNLTRLSMLACAMLLINPSFAAVGKAVQESPSIFTNLLFDLLLVTVLILLFVIISMGRVIRHLLNAGIKKMNPGNTLMSFLALISFSLIAVDANAQTETNNVTANTFMGVPSEIAGIDSWIFVSLVFLILAELVIILVLTMTVKRIMLGLGFQPEPVVKEHKPWFNWSWINRKLTDSVPVEAEETILTDHNYDGIHELDNNLPPWWKYGFYLTILFAIFYMMDYHVLKSSPLSLEEYNQELVAADIEKQARLKEMAANVDENTVTQLKDEASLFAGQATYVQNCVACHGKLGEGGVGPNFTDENWIHGGGIKNLFKTIKYGVPDKGMISWQNQLNPEGIQSVASYILTMAGTNPPNPKAPQGEIWRDTINTAPDSVAVQTK